jgi:diacylglycerol O-acyltransferase
MTMKRLSGTDALFLSTETPAWHQHVGGIAVLDPSESARFSFEEVRRVTLERLERVPKFRWKLKEVPLHLDRALWVEDQHFHIDNHVRRIAVPPPGGRRELGDLLGMFMGYQLDRRRPLWELWYVDGLVNGQVALISKYHHCLMDGMTGAGLADQLLDLEPDPPAAPAPAGEAPPGPSAPSDLELVARSLLPTIQTPFKVASYLYTTARRGITILQQRETNPLQRGVGGPCFNGAIGPHRANAFASVALQDVKAVKDALGVKLNDVVLALVGGSLRAHMLEHGELPDRSLVAGVPLSTRLADDDSDTNRVAVMSAALGTDLEDPVERVKAIFASTQSAKELTDAIRARAIQSVGEVAPPLLLNVASRAAWAANIGDRVPVVQNLVVSNVPGPPFSLYVCGAKVTGIYSGSVLMANMGLNVTLMSYMDRIDFGLTCDPDLLEDHWGVADGIVAELAALMEATGLGTPTKVLDPFDKRPARRTAKA